MKKFFLFFLCITLFSCTTTIINLKDNPQSYIGKSVKINGEITKIIKIPFTDYSLFEFKDKTGNILVFSLKDHVKGENLTITTKVIVYDSSEQEKSTKIIIDNIENFILETLKIDESKVKKISDLIAKAAVKILDSMNASYFLIETN